MARGGDGARERGGGRLAIDLVSSLQVGDVGETSFWVFCLGRKNGNSGRGGFLSASRSEAIFTPAG